MVNSRASGSGLFAGSLSVPDFCYEQTHSSCGGRFYSYGNQFKPHAGRNHLSNENLYFHTAVLYFWKCMPSFLSNPVLLNTGTSLHRQKCPVSAEDWDVSRTSTGISYTCWGSECISPSWRKHGNFWKYENIPFLLWLGMLGKPQPLLVGAAFKLSLCCLALTWDTAPTMPGQCWPHPRAGAAPVPQGCPGCRILPSSTWGPLSTPETGVCGALTDLCRAFCLHCPRNGGWHSFPFLH